MFVFVVVVVVVVVFCSAVSFIQMVTTWLPGHVTVACDCGTC